MVHILSKFLPIPFYPLGLSVVLLAVALVLLGRSRRRAAMALVCCALGVLYAFSLPATASLVAGPLERRHWPLHEYPRVSAVVLLGGAGVPAAAPRRFPETNIFGDRLIHAARVFRDSHAPWLICTGGKLEFVHAMATTEAYNTSRLLIDVFGVDSTRVLLAEGSRNTREDAQEVVRVLGEKDERYDVLLVTSAVHMDRASKVFRKAGIGTLEAPTDYMTECAFQWKLLKFLPSADALHVVDLALHEYYGLLAYRVLGWI